MWSEGYKSQYSFLASELVSWRTAGARFSPVFRIHMTIHLEFRIWGPDWISDWSHL